MYVNIHRFNPAYAAETGGTNPGVELFLTALNLVPLLLLLVVIAWVIRDAIKAGRKKAQKSEEYKKAPLHQKIWMAQADLWDANAVNGQALMLAVTHYAFYNVDLWFGFITKLEAAVVLAISTVFATLLLAATDFDGEREKGPLWVLTFMASASFGALLASLFVDVHDCAKQHGCTTPSMLFNIFSMIGIGVAYWKVGSLSRNSRWHRFMAMNPPQSLVVILTCIGAGKLRYHVRVDKVVQAFLNLNFDGVLHGDTEEEYEGLEQLNLLIPEKVREPLFKKAVAAVEGWIDTIDSSTHHPHLDEQHAAHPMHVG